VSSFWAPDDLGCDVHTGDGRLTVTLLAVHRRDVLASDHLTERLAIGSARVRDKYALNSKAPGQLNGHNEGAPVAYVPSDLAYGQAAQPERTPLASPDVDFDAGKPARRLRTPADLA
jgi:hypothetical protein